MSDATIEIIIHYTVLISAFAVAWFLALFCLLPVGLGAERDPESGAPLSPMLAKKAKIAAVIAAVLWVGFYITLRLGWMQL